GVLGILKAGAAYVPLDPAYPAERRAFMLADSRAAVLVTHEQLVAELPASVAHVLCLDRDVDTLDRHSTANPTPGVTPDTLAYVLYTSGSTGKPKGVAVQHRSLVNFVCSMRRQPGMGSDDVLLAVTSLSFDIHVLELLLPLTLGARVVVATRQAT